VLQTRDAERTWPWHGGTYEMVQNFHHTEKVGEGAQRKEPYVGYARARGGTHLGSQEGGVSNEFLLRRRWPALGEGFRQSYI